MAALLAGGALLTSLMAPAAMAATITVDPTAADDATAADGKCSLREAVISINTGGSMGDCVAVVTEAFGVNDTIVLPAGTYTLTRQGIDETYSDNSPGDPASVPVVVNTPDATQGDLDLQKSVKIVGAGTGSTIIEWDVALVGDRIFHVIADAGTINVVLDGLDVRNGTPREVDIKVGPASGSGALETRYYLRRAGGGIAVGPAAAVVLVDPNVTGSANSGGRGGSKRPESGEEGGAKGGPSDIVVRRGMGGLQPANMVPAVDAACATSDYATAIGLSNTLAENISSRSPSLTAADNGLADGTEVNYTENALAHRGVLRGGDLWIGYSYTTDLVKLWAQLDNYNFWLRKYTFAAGTGSWALPRNVTNIADKRINVREPRIFGTPKSSTTTCPSGVPTDPTTTDPTACQNTDVIYLAWGTQENVSPYFPGGGDNLGIFITASIDGAQTFYPPIRYSLAAGRLFQDDESAYESQVVTRPDGGVFYGVWNQADATVQVAPGVNKTVAEYASGSLAAIVSP